MTRHIKDKRLSVSFGAISSPKLRRKRQAGQTIIMASLGIVFLIGILGLVVDIGYGYYIKQVAQAAADSAVMAGAAFANANGSICDGTVVLCPSGGSTCPASPTSPPVTNFDAACLYAKANGFPSTGNQTVKIYGGTGSQSGSGVSGGNYWMSVTATQTMPLGFLSVIGAQSATISASASSTNFSLGSAGGCIYVLDTNGGPAFNAPGTSGLTSNCGIYVNSSATNAFRVQGNATITAGTIKVVGTSSISNNATVTPTPTNGVSAVSDPFEHLGSPTVSGCDVTGYQLSGGTATLSPGTYCNGIKISGGTVTLNSGVYVLRGIGLQLSGNGTVINGSGVMFYNTGDSTYPAGTFTLGSGVTTNLSAPTSGAYKGILLYQDRTVSTVGTIGGGSNQNFSGTIYMPNAYVNFNGGSTTNALTAAIIVKDINLVGNSYLAADTTGNITGLTQTSISLTQ
jgi:hypothetical protein